MIVGLVLEYLATISGMCLLRLLSNMYWFLPIQPNDSTWVLNGTGRYESSNKNGDGASTNDAMSTMLGNVADTATIRRGGELFVRSISLTIEKHQGKVVLRVWNYSFHYRDSPTILCDRWLLCARGFTYGFHTTYDRFQARASIIVPN